MDEYNAEGRGFQCQLLDTGRIGEDLYSLPFQNSLYYMYWNKDLFEKAGLDPETPPQNFEEWTQMAAKITDPDSNVYGSGLFMAYGNQEMCLMQQKGGLAVEQQSDGKYKVNIEGNEGYKEYLEWMKALYTNGDNPQENEIDSMFKAGQIGIMVNGPWLAPVRTNPVLTSVCARFLVRNLSVMWRASSLPAVRRMKKSWHVKDSCSGGIREMKAVR